MILAPNHGPAVFLVAPKHYTVHLLPQCNCSSLTNLKRNNANFTFPITCRRCQRLYLRSANLTLISVLYDALLRHKSENPLLGCEENRKDMPRTACPQIIESENVPDPIDTAKNTTDPAELRGIFGANLRQLAHNYPSIAGLCRQLGINRTQFNRYLSGESFPRPDVLHRICVFFDLDARILLEPVSDIEPAGNDLFNHPEIADFLGGGSVNVDEEQFPSGFYRFSRPSFIDDVLFVVGLVYVFRKDGVSFIRGYEPKEAMIQQGLKTDTASREFRGVLLRQEQGIAALIARHKALTCTFNFLSRVSSYENNFWEGYATRTVRESHTGRRAARMVYEHIQSNPGAIFNTARHGGMKRREDLHPFHAKLLNLDRGFK